MRYMPLALLLALTVASGTAVAQDAIRLSSVEGEVGVSRGGEFVGARDGQTVLPGQQLLIGPDSSATVTYPDDCRMHYLLPGQFPILPECDPTRSRDRSQEQQQATASNALTTTAVVGGAVVGAAAIIDQALDDDDDSEDAPVSP